MTLAKTADWQEANQRYLTAALAVVREAVERCAESSGSPGIDQDATVRASGADRAFEEARQALPEPAALDVLCATFDLSPFERAVLLLCAGMELDSRFADLCAHPTFGLALTALPEAHWSALSPEAPLRRWRLIELGKGDALVSSPLRIDERVLHFLTGVPAYVDERLRGYLEAVPAPGELPPSHAALARQIVNLWTAPAGTGPRPAVQLTGKETAGKRQIAAAACSELGLGLHALSAHDVPPAPAEREALARLWQRESVLSGSVLLIDCEDFDDAALTRTVRAFVDELAGLLLMSSRDPLELRQQTARLEVERPSTAEQRRLWRSALGPLAVRLDGGVAAVASQFSLGVEGIRAASAEVAAEAGNDDLGRRLWSACRSQARVRLDDLAQRIEPAASWDDLVLPAPQREILRQVAAHLRRRATVYDDWGFAAKCVRGLGISALFAGPSGTGKTMAAEVLANELDLDLYRIDLSAVVSKYIGETEKNLRRVFDAAEASGAILLFDEADALFGRRGEVKDSHDRYANIEVSYLLQRMEAYLGLAVLTTNRKEDLDPAFLRRIRFMVQFPFPDATLRAEIWRRIFPAESPTERLNPERLARLNAPGGNIRNIALGAAFLAADAGEAVGMRHLRRAAQSEYAKLEKSLTEGEVGGWE